MHKGVGVSGVDALNTRVEPQLATKACHRVEIGIEPVQEFSLETDLGLSVGPDDLRVSLGGCGHVGKFVASEFC